MALLSVLVALFGAVTLLNLLLTFGIIRRLRERPASPAAQYPGVLSAGALVGDFTAIDLQQRPLSRDGFAGRTLVGFFSPDCEYCRERLPDFVAAARSADFGPDRTWAVVLGDADAAAEYLPSLTPVARVALQDPDGPLLAAFAVTAFPSFFLVDATGRIVAGGITVRDLPVAAAA